MYIAWCACAQMCVDAIDIAKVWSYGCLQTLNTLATT